MAYGWRIPVTIDSTKVGGATHTNFTVCVQGTYTDLRTVANGGKAQNGNDIAFFSDSALTTQLKHAVINYSATTGVVTYHVKIPSLIHTADTVIYIGVGDAAVVTSQADAANTWDTNTKGVYEFEDGTTLNGTDQLGANNLTLVGTPTAAGGTLGLGAASFNGTSQYAQGSNVSVQTFPLTMSCAFRATTVTGTRHLVGLTDASDDTQFWRMAVENSKLRYDANPGYVGGAGATTLSVDTWYWVAFVAIADTDRRLYLNGVEEWNQAGNTGSRVDIDRFCVGAFSRTTAADFFSGRIDHVKLANTNRSVQWLLAEYNNQSAPSTFLSFGTPVDLGGSGGATTFDSDAFDTNAFDTGAFDLGAGGEGGGGASTGARRRRTAIALFLRLMRHR